MAAVLRVRRSAATPTPPSGGSAGPEVGQRIKFLSDELTDKGPATGEIVGVKTTVDGLYVTVQFGDRQESFSWDDLDEGGADIRGGLWMVKSHPALFPGPASHAQAEAGNFKKRRIAWRGLTLRVENEAGTVREGHGWSTRMLFPYGEVEDTVGLDGDRVDVYIGPALEAAELVYVVHQRKYGRWDEHDEDKVMLGFTSEEEAATVYLKHYDDPRFLGPITVMPVAEFVARCRGEEEVTRLGKSWFGEADLLKALLKKMVTVPGYYKADGSYIGPHQKMVHYNDEHTFHDVAHGGVSHSQKEAHKKLAKEDWFAKLAVDDKAIHVMSLATDIQESNSASAAVVGWKQAALAGKNPTPAQWSGFSKQSKDKQAALYDQIKAATNTLQHLKPPEKSDAPTRTPVADESVKPASAENQKLWTGLKKELTEEYPPGSGQPAVSHDYVQAVIDAKGYGSWHILVLAHEWMKKYGAAAAANTALLSKLQDATAKLEQIEKSGSHYQKAALAKLKLGPDFDNVSPIYQLEAVMNLYKQLQGAASQAAAVSMWKKAILAGNVPSPAQHAAVAALHDTDLKQYQKLFHSVVDVVGPAKLLELMQASENKTAGAPITAKNATKPVPFSAASLAAAQGFPPPPAPLSDTATAAGLNLGSGYKDWYVPPSALPRHHVDASHLVSVAHLFGSHASHPAVHNIAVMLVAGDVEGAKAGVAGLPVSVPKSARAAATAMIEKYSVLSVVPHDKQWAVSSIFNTLLVGAELNKEGWNALNEQPDSTKYKLMGGVAIAALGLPTPAKQNEAIAFTQQQFAKNVKFADKNAQMAAVPAKKPRVASVKSTMKKMAVVFKHTSDGHNKQWAVSTHGNELITSFGPIGKTQQISVKTFATKQDAIDAQYKLIHEKTNKGYHQANVGSVTHEHTTSTPAYVKAVAAAFVAPGAAPAAPSTFMPDGTPLPADVVFQQNNPVTYSPSLQVPKNDGGYVILTYNKALNAYTVGAYSKVGNLIEGKTEASSVAVAYWLDKAGTTKKLDMGHLAALKVSAFADTGPKDGDTKQGAEGVLVFKDGHWHKQPGTGLTHDEVTAAMKGITDVSAKYNNKYVAPAIEAAKNGDVAKIEALLKEIGGQSGAPNTKKHLIALHAALSKKHGATVKKLSKEKASKVVARALIPMGGGLGPSSFGNKLIIQAKALANAGNINGLHALKASLAGKPTPKVEAAIDALIFSLGGNPGDSVVAASGKPMPAPAPVAPPTVAAPAKAPGNPPPIPKAKSGEPQDMSGWTKVGEKIGTNPGGSFKDKQGKVWYCKFPASPEIARNEVLAAKFYQMMGFAVPNLKLVRSKDGKVGIASAWVDGISKVNAATLAAAPGAREGFAVDAWLGNWDVVGLSNDNLMVGKDGKAVRVDVGGSLIYRAQGGKKPDFGDDVPELKSLLDPKVNAKAAAVFAGLSQSQVMNGVVQLNKLKPSQIRELVEKIGPGDANEKSKLTQTLIARRAFILNHYGVADQWAKKAVDETKVPVDPKVLPKPLDFQTMNSGKGLSSKTHVNEQNSKDSAALVSFAAKGNLKALKEYHYDAVDKESGVAKGKKPITEHPANQIQQQWASLVQTLQSIAYPPVEALDMPPLGLGGSLEEVAASAGAFGPHHNVTTVPAEHRYGYFMNLGHIDTDAAKELDAELAKKQHYIPQDQSAPFVHKAQTHYQKGSTLVHQYIGGVQGSGSVNHIWSQGKQSWNSTPINKLTKAIYDEAMEVPEGMILNRWMDDDTAADAMTAQLLKSGAGSVLQNTDSMCASMWKGWEAHPHFCSEKNKAIRLRIRCAKGAKVSPSFGSGNHWGEGELTTLPGARFVVTAVRNGDASHPNGIVVECIMLPPDPGFVAQLSGGASLKKAFSPKGLMSWLPSSRTVFLLMRSLSRGARVTSVTRQQ